MPDTYPSPRSLRLFAALPAAVRARMREAAGPGWAVCGAATARNPSFTATLWADLVAGPGPSPDVRAGYWDEPGVVGFLPCDPTAVLAAVTPDGCAWHLDGWNRSSVVAVIGDEQDREDPLPCGSGAQCSCPSAIEAALACACAVCGVEVER
jgi:hypothetical protein